MSIMDVSSHEWGMISAKFLVRSYVRYIDAPVVSDENQAGGDGET